jgi:hypothetical protein
LIISDISVATICVVITATWLSAYNYVRLGINPIEYITESSANIFNEENDDSGTIVTIKGSGLKEDLELSMKDLKSDKYYQVENKEYKIVTQVEPHYIIYSGVSLWSILEEENLLNKSSSELTFIFVARDGYQSQALSLDRAENNAKWKVILAYERDGEPLTNDGPIRSVIDHSVVSDIPDAYSSQYSVKYLKYVIIE